MSKIINIPGRMHSTEKGNVSVGANEVLDDTKGKKQNVINSETDAELLRLSNEKQDNLTFDNAPTENSNNPVKSSGVYAADKALSDAIEAILLLIPSDATSLNKLVDTATMNSSISTATATFRGTYNAVTDLGLTYQATHEQIAAALDALNLPADNNDYAFVQVPVSDESTEIRRTERYKHNDTNWGYEYDLNTSGFTAAQWAALNSGITVLLVAKLGALPTADELTTLLGAKQDTLTFDSEPMASSTNPVTSGGVYAAILAVSTALSAYQGVIDPKIAAIEGKIPSGASSSNQLTAKDYVDGIQTTLQGYIDTINGKIPAAAASNNQLTDKNYVDTIIAGITAKIPSAATGENQLVDTAAMMTYVAGIINAIDASFNVTSTDDHITLHITQVDGVITSVQVQGTDIASAAALTVLTGRVTTAEGNISSLTDRMGTAETNISNLQQLYNNLQQSKPVPVTALPSTGQQQGVIYRLAGTTSYSDYMWNGSSWVLMATYNNAIDTQPIEGSENLVSSGGVFARIVKATGFCKFNEDAVLSTNPSFGSYYYTGKLITSDSVNEGDIVYFRFRSAAGSAAHIHFYDNTNTLIQSFGNNVSQSIKTTTNKFKIPANFGYAYFEQTLNPISGVSHFDYIYSDKSNIKLYEEDKNLRNFIEQSSGFYLKGKEITMSLNSDFGQYYYSEKVITKDSVNVGDIIKFKFKNAAGNSAFIYFCDESGTLLASQGSNISQSVTTTEGVYTIPSGFGYAYFVQANSTGVITCDYLWKDYSNQELMELIGTISGQVDVCLPTDDLQQYVNTHRHVNLTSGVYNISTPIVIPSNTKIVGIRGESVVKGNGNLFNVSGKSNIQIENITFEGSGAVTRQAVPLADLRAKTGFTNTNSGIIATSHAENCNIVNCEFKNFASCGIYLDHTMASTSEIARNVNIDKCQFYNNYCGIRLGVRAEFHNISNCEINFNTVGVMVEGGNNTIVACHIDLNGVGFCVSGTAGNNDSHGKIGDCSMNHSSGYAMACVDINNGYTFSNCHIFDGAGIMISNSIGFAYNGGMIGCKIIIDTPRSAGFNMINDVMFGNPSSYDTGVIEGDTTRLSLKNNRYLVQDDYTGINNTN